VLLPHDATQKAMDNLNKQYLNDTGEGPRKDR
jgi:hypothetical protein